MLTCTGRGRTGGEKQDGDAEENQWGAIPAAIGAESEVFELAEFDLPRMKLPPVAA